MIYVYELFESPKSIANPERIIDVLRTKKGQLRDDSFLFKTNYSVYKDGLWFNDQNSTYYMKIICKLLKVRLYSIICLGLGINCMEITL